MPDVNERAKMTNPYKNKMSMSSSPLLEVDSLSDLLNLEIISCISWTWAEILLAGGFV